MKASGSVSDYTATKKSQIAAAIQGILSGQGISVATSAIKILVEAIAGRRLAYAPRRVLQSAAGVTITAEITVPTSSSLGDVNSKLSSSAAETALVTTLGTVGVTVTEYSVDGAGGSSGLSGGAIAGIVIGVIVGVVLLVGIFCYCKRSMAQTAMKG